MTRIAIALALGIALAGARGGGDHHSNLVGSEPDNPAVSRTIPASAQLPSPKAEDAKPARIALSRTAEVARR